MQVRPKIDLTFSICLRHTVRQDPDIIMVGEIRDVETAQHAVQASLTGHLVFSTLQTNDAAGTLTRLIDMGVEPFLITSTLKGVLAQRLVRRICKNCREPYVPDEAALESLDLTPEDIKGKVIYYGKGCETCNNIGYSGRIAISELLVLNDNIRSLIIQKVPLSELREAARKQGMKTLREDGLDKIYEGVTTIEEVLGETQYYG